MRPNEVPSVPEDAAVESAPPTVGLLSTTDPSDDVESTVEAAESRPLNYAFAVGLLVVALLCAVSVFLLHRYQMGRLSTSLLEQSARAEEEGRLKDAARHLRQYVALAPDDESLRSLAFLLDRAADSNRDRFEVLQLLEQVLRADSDDREARRRLVDLCMQFGRMQDALVHLLTLLQSSPGDAELHSLLSQCYLALDKPDEAAAACEAAVQAAPRRIDDYERLAAVLYEELDRADDAAKVMDRMVAANLDAPSAYLARARFRQAYWGADRKMFDDVHRAFRLDPDDPEVLVLAARTLASRQRSGAAPTTLRPEDVRARVEQLITTESDPRLFVAAAELHFLLGRADLSEERLRAGLTAHPDSIELSWRLTDVLLEQSRLQEAEQQLADLKKQNAPRLLIEYLQSRMEMASGKYLEASRRLESIRASALGQRELKAQINMHLGRCYEQIGHLERRLESYRRVTALAAASVPGRLGLAAALADLGRVDDALVQYRQLLEVEGVAAIVVRLLIEQNLRGPESRRDWTEAERILDRSSGPNANAAETLVLRAQLSEHQGNLEQAGQQLQRAVERFPGNPMAWVALAGLQRRQGEVEQAQQTLSNAESQLGRRPELVAAQIASLIALEPDTARRRLDELAGDLASSSTAWRSLGVAYERIGSTDSAKQIWQRLAEQSPDSLDVWLRLFELEFPNPTGENAGDYIEQMRRIEGTEGAYWRLSQARLLLHQARQGERNRLPKARELVAEIIGRLPASPLVPLVLAEIEELEGDIASAVEHYLSAIDRGASSAPLIRHTIELLYKRRRYAEAERVLQRFQGRRRESLPPEFSRMAAGLALRTRDFDSAVAYARAAVEDSPDQRNNLWLGQILQASGQPDEAERAFREALQLDRTVPGPWIALVSLLVGQQRLEEAGELISDAKSHLPAHEAPLVLARCYELMGNTQAAQQNYKLALQQQPTSPPVLWAVAEHQFRSGQVGPSEQLLRTLIDSNETPSGLVASARRTLALVLALRGGFAQFREALDLIDSNLQEAGSNPEDLRAKAKLLAIRPIRKYQLQAISLLMDIDELVPLNKTDQLQLVHLYLGIGHWPHARDSLRALLANHDDNPADLVFAIRKMLEHGEHAGSVVQWIDRLQELQADPVLISELRARLLVARNEFEGALELLEAGPADQPSAPQLRALADAAADLSQQLDRSGRTADATRFASTAEQLYRRLMDRQPDQIVSLIRFLGRQWRIGDALELCKRAWEIAAPEEVALACVDLLRSDRASGEQIAKVRGWIESQIAGTPESAELCFQLANTCHLQGDYKTAEELYRRTIALAPRTVLAYNELATLLALREGHSQEALEVVEQAIQLAGPLAFLLDTRAMAYLSLGKPAEAQSDLEEAIADSPTSVKFFHLTQAHLKSNDRAAANVAYRQGLAAGLHADALHPLERSQFDTVHTGVQQF